MKQKRNYPLATVTRKAQSALENGHPWVYDTEILSLSQEISENGCLIEVVSDKGRYLGTSIISL